jgi:hyaluronate lyase
MGNGLLNLVGEGAGVDAGVAEYADIFPLLDWHELNGVTADFDVPVPDCADVADCCWRDEVLSNSTTWVGAASDGVYGVAVMDTRARAFSSRRAWFFLDRAVIALSADASDASGSTVRTTLASRLLRGPVAGGWENGTVSPELPWQNLTLPIGGADGLAWLAAEGHAWLPWLPAAGPPPAAGAVYSAGRRCGEWSYIGAYSGTTCNDTLTLALDHGAGLHGSKYGYALLPNVSAADAPAAASAARGLAVVNGGAADGGVQAVSDARARVALAAFWAPVGGAVTLGAGGAWPITITADIACLSAYSEDGAGGATLAVSAPTPGGQAVALTVDRALAPGADCPATPAPGGASTLIARLPPAGNFQGQSVVFRCKLVGSAQ